MPMLPLIAPYYDLKQKGLSSCRLINWYIEQFEPDAPVKSPKAAIPTPGAVLKATPAGASGRCRGNFLAPVGPLPDRQPRLYSVYGEDVWRWNSDMSAAEKIGRVTDNGTPVTMCSNQFDFIICDAGDIYWRSMTEDDGSPAVLQPIALPEQPGVQPAVRIRPTHVDVLAQRLVCNSAYNSNQWFYTDLPTASGTFVFADSNFYTAESSPDVINALTSTKGSLVMLGTRSTELWGTQNNRLSPFTAVGGTATGVGTEAPYSVAKCGDFTFFLGSSDTGSAGVFLMEGTQSTRISNNAVEETIMSFGTSAQKLAIGSSYSWTGETFYIIDFPSENRTFVWGSTSKTWHERLYHDVPSGDWKSYKYRHPVYHMGKIWMGINDAPGLVYLDPDTYQEYDGNNIIRQLVTSVQWDQLMEIQARELTVDCETGTTAVLTGLGSEPKLLLETSRDGGYKYSSIDKKSLGKQGEYRKIVRWGPRGMSRKFTFRLTFSDRCSCTLYQARLDYSLCSRN